MLTERGRERRGRRVRGVSLLWCLIELVCSNGGNEQTIVSGPPNMRPPATRTKKAMPRTTHDARRGALFWTGRTVACGEGEGGEGKETRKKPRKPQPPYFFSSFSLSHIFCHFVAERRRRLSFSVSASSPFGRKST